MIKLSIPHRTAKLEDARAMTRFVDMAGEGLASYVWEKSATPGVSCWDVGVERARRETGSFSYRNTVLRDQDGITTACLIGYPLPDQQEIIDYSELPAMFIPLQELEDQALGTWYVNVLATLPEARGKGYGQQLLNIAEQYGKEESKSGLSLIVSDANTAARRLYERFGFVVTDKRGIVKEQWQHPGKNWLLMIKKFSN